jgi:hypothetical protein
MKTPLFIRPTFFLVFCFFLLSTVSAFSQENFRILPYLQVYETGKVQLTWFSDSPQASRISIKNSSGIELVNKEVIGVEVPEIYYTTQEKSQSIIGLTQGSWLKGDKSYRYRIQADLPAGISVDYTVTLGGNNFTSSFKTPVSKSNWDKIRFIALSDSETEPKGRVTNRAWYPGTPFIRPFAIPQLWKDKFGTTVEQGFELPNYLLNEKVGYAENLKIINSRNPNFMLMPGDLVQGGGYQPGWDEFFRHNAGDFDSGLSKYPIIPALGNWEAFGGVNGGYATDEKGKFLPLVGRSRFHAYFQTPTNDPLQKHRQSYYRVDYGPVTILTLDSSNGTPEQQASDFDGTTKLTGTQFTVPGTDTQENFTQTQYAGYGGTDLSGFGPGTDQYIWLEENLKTASAAGQLIFVQYHHIAFSSGEHGVPLNHELSIGQVGTPLRVLNPLLEKYGVIAVFSGHDELFERSFVDEDGDGKGIDYYDVGVAGDGMRGEKRDWLKTPLQTLNYNQFRQWTADQSSVENWNTSGAVPLLIDGGKHYGHLEVNLTKVIQDGKPFARIDFSPVYAFPVLDQNYNLQRIERRVYPDERSLMVALNETDFIPVVKDSVSIFLNQEGKAFLTPDDFLEVLPDDPFTYTSSKGFDFTCLNFGVNDVVITSKNTLTAQEWTESTKVWVLDTIPPDFEATDANLAFDKTIGKVIIDANSFYIRQEYIVENCMIPFGVNVSISVREITCADLDPDGSYFDKPVTITMTDRSGNSTSKIRKINLNVIESKKVSISSSETFVGQPVTLTLGDELVYSVNSWHRSFQGQTQVFPDQKGKTFVATLPGTYFASLYLESACGVASEQITLEVQEADYTPVVKDSVSIFLNEQGKAVLTPDDFLEVLPDDPFTYTSSKGFDFTCLNIGVNDVVITSKNTLTAQEWTESTKVWVLDTIAPYFDAANATYLFDPVVGKVSISLADFDIVDFKDNCAQFWNITPSRFEVTCADIYQNPDQPVWEFPVVLTSTDPSGNSYSRTVKVIIGNVIESKKVSITSLDPLTDDGTSTLKLGNELEYEVLEWIRNGQLIPGQTGKEITVNSPGYYRARIQLSTGCPVFSKDFNFEDPAFPAEYTDDVNLILDEFGKATLTSEDVFGTTDKVADELILGKTNFDCSNLGTQKVKITLNYFFGNNSYIYEFWINVIVKDNQAPILTTKIPSLAFDLVKGVLELKPEDFVASLTDNCGVTDLYLNKTKITCEDYDLPIELILTAKDQSGNITSELLMVSVSSFESKKISITPSGNFQAFSGAPVEIKLGEEFGFSLESWLKDGVPIVAEKGKAILVYEPGTYWARILPDGGCSVLSEKVTITFSDLPYGEVKEIIELPLDESGKASLKPENVFVSWPPADPNLDIKLSQSEFTCSDIGEKEITITIKNQAGQTWEEKTIVKVQDKLKPVLIPKNFNVDFDVTVGTLALKPSDFIAELTDNCGVKEVTINKTTATCEDLGKEIPVAIRAVDASGNIVEAVAILTLNRIETKKVSISGDAEFCEGSKGLLTLNSEAQFEVIRWRRDGVEIEGQKSKTLEIEQGGSYHAVIRYSGGCLSETALFVVERNPLPKGEIEEKGNILIAPAGFTYQWFRNGELISGATLRELVVHQMGEYTVELTSEAGCKAKLKAVEMTISGLGINRVVDAEELKIFPNPASNFLEVEIISDQNTSYSSIRVYGMDGKEVTSSVIISKTGSNSFTFDISKLANATYLVYLEGDSQRTFFGRFSKNE